MNRWEHFHHEADIGVRGYGDNLAASYVEVAKALTAVITDLDSVRAIQCIELTVTAPDNEMLLVDWINALVYEMSIKKMLFSRFDVDIQQHTLNATVCGEPVDVARHQPAVEIKGATYTQLSVSEIVTDLWCSQCVVDV